MSRILSAFIFIVLLTSGCTTTSPFLRTSPQFDQSIAQIKTIAVMPADIEVYSLTAGGMRELIDEWNDIAEQLIKENLKEHLADRFGFTTKFIEEDWLKQNYKDLWNSNRALYNAVAMSALLHTFSMENIFPTKKKNFDYTLGIEVESLANVCQADALLFVYGFDHEATGGRAALAVWNFLLGAALGTVILTPNPSGMFMGVVDAHTGELIWFKTSNPQSEYSFRNEKHINNLMEWLTRDLLKKE